MQTLLNVNNLSVNFDTTQGIFTAVDDVSFYINKGECLGIAGESGSGKTQTFFSITGILSDNGSVSGNAYFNDIDLLRLNEKEISKIIGNLRKILGRSQGTLPGKNRKFPKQGSPQPPRTFREYSSLVLK